MTAPLAPFTRRAIQRQAAEAHAEEAARLIVEHNYSVRDAAARLGIPKTTLHRWLLQHVPPGHKHHRTLRRLLRQHKEPTA